MKTIWLVIYYGIARYLPKSNRPILGRLGGWLRFQCAKHLFAVCRGYVNLEQGAYVGNGRNFHVLGDAAIGKDFVCHKPGKTHVALNLPRGYINYPSVYAEKLVMPVTSITTCMPRRVFDEMGGFPVGIKLGEDFLLWAKTAVHYKVAFCEKPLAYYNNDIPASIRATRNLHAPEYHMLFNLEPLEQELARRESDSPPFMEGQGVGFHLLLDKLRISGLLEYWMSDEYHDVAAVELAKVDWSKQPKSAKAQYEKPIWFLRAKRRFMQVGSRFKQRVIFLLNKK